MSQGFTGHRLRPGEIERDTERGRLAAARGLVQALVASGAPEYRVRDALVGQAALARSREDRDWLSEVARDLDCFQLAGEGWIGRIVLPLRRKATKGERQPGTENKPAGSGKRSLRSEDTTCSVDRKRVRFQGEGPRWQAVVKRGVASPGLEKQVNDQARRGARRQIQRGQNRSGQRCPIPWCTAEFNYPKAHAFNFHFPTGIDMGAEGKLATSRRARALRFLADRLIGPGAPLRALSELGIRQRNSGKTVDNWLEVVTVQLARLLGQNLPTEFSVRGLDSPAIVFHWSVMLVLLARLSWREYNLFIRTFQDPLRHAELRQRLAPEENVTEEAQEKEPVREGREKVNVEVIIEEN